MQPFYIFLGAQSGQWSVALVGSSECVLGAAVDGKDVRRPSSREKTRVIGCASLFLTEVSPPDRRLLFFKSISFVGVGDERGEGAYILRSCPMSITLFDVLGWVYSYLEVSLPVLFTYEGI